MPQEMASLSDFEKLWCLDGKYNIFFGAGLSRDPPTNGPIWTEMQTGFLSALFDRMEMEKWPAVLQATEERRMAADLNIRPEIFWGRMIEFFPHPEVVWRALQSADVGPPNENHDSVASLLANNRCAIAMSTNFDEHIESLLPDTVLPLVPTHMDNDRKINDRTYVKLHGSVSDGVTLSYTLEHYDELKERNTALIQAFANKPLLILGYSGFDTDVYPALKAVADSIPQIVIVKHPGSNPSQPIFELASSHSSAYILEAPCNEVLNILTRNLKGQGYQKIKARRKESQSIINKEAAKMLPMQYCPFALMLAFELVGNWEMVRRYGWLSHDAFDDTRYQGQLPPDLEHKLYMHIAYDLKLAGDENGRKIMLACADSLLNKSGGKLSDAMRAKWNEAYSHKAPNQSSLTNTATRSEDSPSDTLAAIVALNNLISDTSMDGHGNFLNYWQLGVARYRDGKFNESIDAFNIGCELLNKNASTHLESGRFLLDYGTALFEYSLELFKLSKLNEAAENRENSNISFELSEKITRENEDWVTNARVNLMLGKLLLSAEQFERSRSSVDKALESVLKTNDVALQHRINAFSDKLNDLMREMSA